MLKRYQVLLPDWLEDYLKWGADEYNVSLSEIIRLEVCFSVIAAISELHPEYKTGITIKDIMGMIKSYSKNKAEKEDVLRLISKIYFETRKAIEYRFSKIKGEKLTAADRN